VIKVLGLTFSVLAGRAGGGLRAEDYSLLLRGSCMSGGFLW
jgi:hypothetical protein